MIGSESHELMPSGLDLRGSLQRTGRCEKHKPRNTTTISGDADREDHAAPSRSGVGDHECPHASGDRVGLDR